jgi:hypothetical protein
MSYFIQLGNKQVVLARIPNNVIISKRGQHGCQAQCFYSDSILLLSQNYPNGHVNETWTYNDGGMIVSVHPQSGTRDVISGTSPLADCLNKFRR